jgi:hypothetical protein
MLLFLIVVVVFFFFFNLVNLCFFFFFLEVKCKLKILQVGKVYFMGLSVNVRYFGRGIVSFF